MFKPNSIEWNIETLRVTIFVNDKLNPNQLEAWLQTVSENSPSKINKTPSSFLGVSRSTEGFLETKWKANRLDVILSSEIPQSNRTITTFSEVSSLFGRFVDRIPEIGEFAIVDRLAIGLVLSFQVPSESEGLKILSPIIVGLNLPGSARDFSYRINHPCESAVVSGLKINRLATWSVGMVQIIRIHVNQDGSQDQQTIKTDPPAIRLELDINTNEATPLKADQDQLKKLLNELKKIALGVASGGEVFMRESDSTQ